MSRPCRKCGKHIPNRIKIEGQEKNLQNRKFCLDCSPYKKHNTKPDDPSRPAKRRGCYSEWAEDEKKKLMLSVLKRGIQRKRTLIELAGGCCIRCGYNKCERALSFHHKNPQDKCFNLTLNNLWAKKWANVLMEFQKCELVCLVCHAEIEEEKENAKEMNYRKWLGIE